MAFDTLILHINACKTLGLSLRNLVIIKEIEAEPTATKSMHLSLSLTGHLALNKPPPSTYTCIIVTMSL